MAFVESPTSSTASQSQSPPPCPPRQSPTPGGASNLEMSMGEIRAVCGDGQENPWIGVSRKYLKICVSETVYFQETC
jgi:hypothetical protein